MDTSSHTEQAVKVETEVQNISDHGYKWRVLFSVVFGTFMVILDSTAVNVAVPTLQKVFGSPGHPLSVDQIDGALTAYILALGIITPLAGYLSDRFGIKRMYLLSLALFVMGSLLCSIAPTLPTLVLFRALQGLGGGMLGPLGISLLFGAFAENERGLAFGIYGIPLVVAPASGPVLGGYFVQYLDWRYIFYINIPIGIAGLILGLLWLRENKRGTAVRFDLPGVLLSTLSFGCLLYAIQRGQSDGWTSLPILLLFIVGGIAFILFVFVELLTKEPLLNLRLFNLRTYTFANIIGWVSGIALFGAEFLLPIYLQVLRGKTPLEAGLLVLPLAISAGIVTPLAGALYNRIGGRWLIALGSLILAINTWELAHISLDTPETTLMLIVGLRGIGLGLILQTTLTTALSRLRSEQLPRASALLNATRNVFQSFGIAMLGTIVANRLIAYQDAARNDLSNPLTTLGKQFKQGVDMLVSQHVPMKKAVDITTGKLLGSLFPHHYMEALNNAYYVTFWLSIAALLLAFTLPGRPRKVDKEG